MRNYKVKMRNSKFNLTASGWDRPRLTLVHLAGQLIVPDTDPRLVNCSRTICLKNIRGTDVVRVLACTVHGSSLFQFFS